MDRSEEITPEELASIPDPVLATSVAPTGAAGTASAASGPAPAAAALTGAAPAALDSTARAGSASASGEVPPPSGGAAGASGSLWRVQIFASPDLSQAGRIAREASAKFGEPAVVEFEGSLYKVRLGAFTSEALAQSLRERAVSGGYPGAFRMRSSP